MHRRPLSLSCNSLMCLFLCLACGDDAAPAASDDSDAAAETESDATDLEDAGEESTDETDPPTSPTDGEALTDEAPEAGAPDTAEAGAPSVADADTPEPEDTDPEVTDPDITDPDVMADADAPLEPVDGGTDEPSEVEAGEPDPGGHLAQGWIDLAELDGQPGFRRFYGTPEGNGTLGVPIAASWDLDGDDHIDYAMSAFQASPLERLGAGQVYVVFGDSSVSGDIDLAQQRDDVLMVYGDTTLEGTGSEVWIDDVTGDGIGDLLVCRQNYRASNPDRRGAGALSIIVGGPHLRTQLESGEPIDLRDPPPEVPVYTLIGPEDLGRFAIWARGGDVTGDGVADLVVGADQEGVDDEINHGAAYVIRGGEHLAESATIDLIDFGATALSGHIARITPPAGEGSRRYHFGATVNVADLDRNGKAEVIAAAALSRSGAGYRPEDAPGGSVESQGGAPGGQVYIAWDDNFPDGEWEPGYTIDVADAPGDVTVLMPSQREDMSDRQLGEELIGGADYDGDGRPDLFVGDMTAVAASGRANGGLGFVIFDAAQLRERETFTPLQPEAEIAVSVLRGPSAGAISADTVHHADFDGDGMTDLAVAAPNANPDGRIQAGIVYVLWGNTQRWPDEVDFANLPGADLVQITEVWGVLGADGSDGGDMLAYSADTADIDGDGLSELIVNEMGGNGTSAAAEDAGNLLVISGALLAASRPDCMGVLGGEAQIDSCGRCAGGTSGVLPDEGCVMFQQQVLPLLLGECSQCHGNSGGLSVFSYDLLMAGTSDHGPVILPGDADQSALLQKIDREPPFGDPMPPDYVLPEDQVQIIRDWVNEGARDN